MIAVSTMHVRCHGRGQVPRSGGVLVVCNHQSHFDPVLVGLAVDRRLNFLARDTLFGFAPFRWLIRSLDAIPIDREGLGLSGLKETLRRLAQGEMVLVFPEGARTHDGEIAPLKPGFSLLVRRARVPIVPVVLEGPFEAWPRQQKLPRVPLLEIDIGPTLMPEEVAHLREDVLVPLLEARLREGLVRARRRRERRQGDPPRVGRGHR